MEKLGACVVFDEEGEDLVFAEDDNNCSAEDCFFDETIGALQELLLEDAFVRKQQAFLDRWCAHFENTEQNKLEHMDIFENYTDMIEAHIEAELTARVKGFEMQSFHSMLMSRPEDEICGDVFEMLMSLGDFSAFKELMISHNLGAAMSDLFLGATEPPTTKSLQLGQRDRMRRSPLDGSLGFQSSRK
ncbi:unnamed protein product [Chrysoparadoxa australica]